MGSSWLVACGSRARGLAAPATTLPLIGLVGRA